MKKIVSLAMAAAIVSTLSMGMPVLAADNVASIPVIDFETSECPDYEHIHEEDILEEDNSFLSPLPLSEVHCQSSGGTIGRLLVTGTTTNTIKSESRTCKHGKVGKSDIRYYYQKVTSYKCSECKFTVTKKGTEYWGNWICK